jgi:hypothetical protein
MKSHKKLNVTLFQMFELIDLSKNLAKPQEHDVKSTTQYLFVKYIFIR